MSRRTGTISVPTFGLTAKYLEVCYQGYFMCRMPTAPDPMHERRGLSGYTMALAHEDPLDRIIRMQESDYVLRNMRRPADVSRARVGIMVREVRFDGVVYPPGMERLAGARVSLRGPDGADEGACLESANDLLLSSQHLAWVLDPFHLHIEHRDTGVSIEATDHLDPAQPELAIWQIEDPRIYARRLPMAFERRSSEAAQAVGIFDIYSYVCDRRRWLRERVTRLGARLMQETDAGQREALAAQQQGYESRLFQLERWGERMMESLGLQISWQFQTNGVQTIHGDLGGAVQPDKPWLVRMWLGAWDGDLFFAYMRGSVSIPFLPRL